MRKAVENSSGAAFSRPCSHKNCSKEGLYLAPRRENTGEPYYFCLEHVREYNARWNAFENFSPEEIEKAIRFSTIWERPTWPLGRAASRGRRGKKAGALPEKIRVALAVLGLTPSVSFTEVKAAHRKQAKKYHPDSNAGSPANIEKFHNLQQAFATLRDYYGRKKKLKEEQNDSAANVAKSA